MSRSSGRGRMLLFVPAAALLFCGCLSSKSSNQATPAANAPVLAPVPSTSPAGTAQPSAGATIVSQAQPGATGTVIAGVISLDGVAPPAGSTLFLGLVKSADDQNPQTCIDARRDPVNEQGQFYAQIACAPQRSDMLLYVLVIGPEGDRNWRRGVMSMPADLANVRINATTTG